ncbi:hypothetical protein FHG87_007760 [Trinorchestia longiramus]|nr:hypothetical protein FHG87_007760 [Trinorchestia longiramus]
MSRHSPTQEHRHREQRQMVCLHTPRYYDDFLPATSLPPDAWPGCCAVMAGAKQTHALHNQVTEHTFFYAAQLMTLQNVSSTLLVQSLSLSTPQLHVDVRFPQTLRGCHRSPRTNTPWMSSVSTNSKSIMARWKAGTHSPTSPTPNTSVVTVWSCCVRSASTSEKSSSCSSKSSSSTSSCSTMSSYSSRSKNKCSSKASGRVCYEEHEKCAYRLPCEVTCGSTVSCDCSGSDSCSLSSSTRNTCCKQTCCQSNSSSSCSSTFCPSSNACSSTCCLLRSSSSTACASRCTSSSSSTCSDARTLDKAVSCDGTSTHNNYSVTKSIDRILCGKTLRHASKKLSQFCGQCSSSSHTADRCHVN